MAASCDPGIGCSDSIWPKWWSSLIIRITLLERQDQLYE